MKSNIFEIRDLSHSYRLGNLDVRALDRVTADIPRAGLTCLEGPSGSGKSTLLSILGLIEAVGKGQVSFDDQDIGGLREMERNRLRRHHMAFIFQDFLLFNVLTAAENVEFFLARQGVGGRQRRQRVEWALEMVGLADQMHKLPSNMSGGQRQRVAVARAIAKNPKVIFADEPTASLDQANGRAVVEILLHLTQTERTTVIMASHDPMAVQYATQRLRLADGCLLQGASNAR